ncbi:methyltransferase domain-containing protein [Microbacterium lacus]|uniref:class I SAM-dependent methyltransferase n=1 Tax=Microbacterium lacus TaxID=415217 RepID=UPI0038517178
MSEHTVSEAGAAFAERLFLQVLGGMETLAVYVGDRLGLYRALADSPLTVDELSAQTGMHPRYAREWLEQQAVSGVLTVDDSDAERRFALPPAYAEVLTDPQSLAYTTPFARMLMASASRMPDLLRSYREGGGVGWSEFGADARDAQGDANRPWFERELGPALASVPSVHEMISRPGARLADVGCGHGWSTIALARAYPSATVQGIDVDEPSLVAAREHAAGIDSVSFHLSDGAALTAGEELFDACFVFEALHDMPRPVEVLSAMRQALRPEGAVIVVDEAIADAFAADGDEVERIMYAYSLFLCLPDSMSTPGSVATGTVMRASTLEGYARDAGFSGVEVLPIEGFAAFRFYRLTP